MKKIMLLFLLFLYILSINHGELGSPDLSVSASVSPDPLKRGNSGILTVTVSEVGGEDWAKDVVVKAYSSNDGIDITPYESSSIDIDKYDSATFTFNVDVDKNTPTGEKTIYLEIDYIDTGWMNIGDYPHSKTYTLTFDVIPNYGSLYIESNPSGADVYVDGYYEGTSPVTISEILPGTYHIKITKDGYNDYSESVYISPGDSKILNAKLNAIYDNYNNLSNDNNLLIIALLFIGLIVIGGGAYFITRKKPKTDNSAEVKNTAKENIKADNNYKSTSKNTKTTYNPAPKKKEPTTTIPDFPKELLNKYIPLEKLGEGGFGKVFKVKRKGGTQPLAIKTPNLDEKAKKYLLKEIRAWQNLNHPNIVKMYDAYEEPTPHIEMEYIEGYNLNGKQIKDLNEYPKPTNPKEAINLIKQIAEGLKHAHDKNIIHRDIKPSNILLTQNLTPKITDWGLAKIGAKSSTATTTKGLTLLYSAPEQIDEEEYGKTDKRTDIYQLGVLFYELLTGRLPYEGTSPTQISLKIVNPDKKPIPPSKINPSLSAFDGLFEKFLAKKKEDKFQSIDELLETLNSLEELIKEKEELKKTLTKTAQKLKTSTDKKEIDKLTRELINSTTKLALNCAKANDKVGLLESLEILKDYIKSDENKKELEGAIKHIEYLIKESIPLGKDTVDKLNVLLNRIKREWR